MPLMNTVGKNDVIIKLAISKSCEFKATPDVAKVVIPYEQGKVYDLTE